MPSKLEHRPAREQSCSSQPVIRARGCQRQTQHPGRPVQVLLLISMQVSMVPACSDRVLCSRPACFGERWLWASSDST